MNVKRILGLLMVCVLILNLSNVEIGAAESKKESVELKELKYANFKDDEKFDDSIYETLVVDFINTTYDKDISIKSSKNLYNFYGDVEAIALNFKNDGYAVININDSSIPEYSFEGSYPVKDMKNKSIYNGPLTYLEIDEQDNLILTLDGEKIEKDKEILDGEYIYHKKSNTISFIPEMFNISSNAVFVDGDIINKTFRNLASSYWCQVDACAILLMYFDDNYDDYIVPSSYESTSKSDDDLQDALVPGYIANTSIGTFDDIAYCLDDWASQYGNANYISHFGFWDYDDYKDCIDDNYPVILGCLQSLAWNGSHFVVGYGWEDVIYNTFESYLIVNDGWGDSYVYVSLDDCNPTTTNWLSD